MSQFMLCKSEYDLKKLNCTPFLNYKINKTILTEVVNEYVPIEQQKNIWVFPEIDDYCTQAQKMMNDGILFQNTKLYYLLYKLYHKCTEFILWYGSDYLQLDEVSNQKDFFDLIEREVKYSCCEIYMIMKKVE